MMFDITVMLLSLAGLALLCVLANPEITDE